MTGKSNKTIREWKDKFFESGGDIPESKRGAYQRSGVLWTNVTLNKKASRYICENATMKGVANLTTASLGQWFLAPLELRRISKKSSVKTAWKWMHKMASWDFRC